MQRSISDGTIIRDWTAANTTTRKPFDDSILSARELMAQSVLSGRRDYH